MVYSGAAERWIAASRKKLNLRGREEGSEMSDKAIEELLEKVAEEINVMMDSSDPPTSPWVLPLLTRRLLPLLEMGQAMRESINPRHRCVKPYDAALQAAKGADRE